MLQKSDMPSRKSEESTGKGGSCLNTASGGGSFVNTGRGGSCKNTGGGDSCFRFLGKDEPGAPGWLWATGCRGPDAEPALEMLSGVPALSVLAGSRMTNDWILANRASVNVYK